VEAPSSLNRGEKITMDFKIVGEGISDLKSVVRIDVTNPEKEAINYYSKNCDITNSTGSYSFDIALNDLPGLWKIRLTEVISGVEKEVSITVK
jgi:hypothetical protein